MRRLCFGGSFNPIHHGHLIGVRAVAEAAGFDRVVFVPSALPPHKLDATSLAAPEHRLAMCRLAIAGETAFEVDDLELTRPGPSYTIDTARELRRRGWDEVHWLIGADMVASLPHWHEPDALLKEVSFVVTRRPGHALEWERLPAQLMPLRDRAIDGPLLAISSTMVRQRVRESRSIRYLTPDAVADYITRNGLYR